MSKVLLVVGMHRSGTSALTGVLNAFGAKVPLASNTRISADNPKGHWEHTEVNRINDDILRHFGMTWAAPGVVDYERIPHNHLRKVSTFLESVLTSKGSAIVAFKDPRFCLLLPVWIGEINKLGRDPVLLFSYRHPSAVAGSLQKRNQMGFERGLFLWIIYNLAAVRAMGDVKCQSVVFPNWTESTEALYTNLAEKLEIVWENAWNDCAETATSFIDKKLVHNKGVAGHKSHLQRVSQQLFELMESGKDNPSNLHFDSGFLSFITEHSAWLDTASELMLDERQLWREKINSLYYLINRNS